MILLHRDICCRLYRCVVLASVALAVPALADARHRAGHVARLVYGQVTSASDHKPLEGVRVSLQGTTIGTIADGDGVFRLTDTTGDTLRVQFTHPCHLPVMVLVPPGGGVEVSLALPLDHRRVREAGCGGRGRWGTSR